MAEGDYKVNGILIRSDGAVYTTTTANMAALAASSGSSLVGFIQSGSGAVARTVQAKERDIVSVKDFGAVGDGVTDDTSAIQAAMNAAFQNNLPLYAPSGSYSITTSLTPTLATGRNLTFPGGMRLFGDGLAATQFLYSGATGYCIDFTTNQNHVDSFLCQDFAIRVTNESASASGIRMPQGGGQRFQRVWFDGAGPTGIGLKLDGIFSGGTFNYHCLIDECRFWKFTNFLGQWLNVDGNLALAIRNSFFSVSTFAGNCVHIKTGRGVHIEDTQFETNHTGTVANQYLIFLENVLGATINTCWFEGETHSASVRVSAGCRNVSIKNPYHYHDKSDGNFLYSDCDAVVNVENLFYQAESEAQVVSGVLLNQASGLGRIQFTGNYIDTNSTGKALGAGDVLNILQSAFEAQLSAQAANVTGDGTDYTIICNTEIFDQGTDYNNATGVFTAPVTGRYQFTASVYLQGLDAAMISGDVSIVTSNRTHYLFSGSWANLRNGANEAIVNGACFIDMDSGDTAELRVRASNSTLTADVGATFTRFAGVLVT